MMTVARAARLFVVCLVAFLSLAAGVADRAAAAQPGFALDVRFTGGGTVASNPAGINCSSSCSGLFPAGQTVTLTAVPIPGWGLVGWGGACKGPVDVPCTVTMNNAQTVTAIFGPLVTINVIGPGFVKLNPGYCSASCAVSLPPGTTWTYDESTYAPGWMFGGWSGDCAPGDPDRCRVTANGPQSVTATFIPIPLPLSVAVTGNGAVASSPSGIDCGQTCTANFPTGASISLTATPTPGWSFTGWGGACNGTGSCTIAMSAAQNLTATFIPIPVRLSVAVTGSGRVLSSPAGIDCGSACSANFAPYAPLALAAAPANGFAFGGWAARASTQRVTASRP